MPNYQPYNPDIQRQPTFQGAFAFSDGKMELREELWYHILYHLTALAYCTITWDSTFVAVLAWLHF